MESTENDLPKQNFEQFDEVFINEFFNGLAAQVDLRLEGLNKGVQKNYTYNYNNGLLKDLFYSIFEAQEKIGNIELLIVAPFFDTNPKFGKEAVVSMLMINLLLYSLAFKLSTKSLQGSKNNAVFGQTNKKMYTYLKNLFGPVFKDAGADQDHPEDLRFVINYPDFVNSKDKIKENTVAFLRRTLPIIAKNFYKYKELFAQNGIDIS